MKRRDLLRFVFFFHPAERKKKRKKKLKKIIEKPSLDVIVERQSYITVRTVSGSSRHRSTRSIPPACVTTVLFETETTKRKGKHASAEFKAY